MPMVDVSVLKEWVENWFYMNRNYHPYSKSNDIPIPELYDILERMPTVDVVRCGECKYYLKSNEKCSLIDTRLHFYETDNVWTEDSHCSWGQRRKDGET